MRRQRRALATLTAPLEGFIVANRLSPTAYAPDLAQVHDSGYGQHAVAAGAFLLEALEAAGIKQGRVVELGCGSGILSGAMASAGFDVWGCDISPAMIRLARRRVPGGEFQVASFVDVRWGECVAVAAVGEIFNYLFDRRNTLAKLARVFERVVQSLVPGGLFLFDVATPGRLGGATQATHMRNTEDWLCVSQATEDAAKQQLRRQITTFTRRGQSGLYRRADEIHRLRLYRPEELTSLLRQAGLRRVTTLAGYGDYRFPAGYVGFLCHKGR